MRTAAQYNQAAIALRSSGRHAEALMLFEEAVGRFPGVAALRQNLAHALYESGATERAAAEYALLLEQDPGSVGVRLALYELLQVLGRRDQALAHQAEALSRQCLFSNVAPREQRSVLLLCTPGDLQSNVPVDFLLDRETTTVHRFYILNRESMNAQKLPPFHVVWNVVAESPESRRTLELVDEFLTARALHALNRPERILSTARERLAETLAGSGAYVAPVARIDRRTLQERELPYGYPSIVRPVGSHAGAGLERLDDDAARSHYAARVQSAEYYVSPFVEYAAEDGYYRKYRIIFVDGAAYPCHLAISQHWMIHYYNAPMAENAWMREEEERFLGDVDNVFGPHRETLERIARETGLEYFGIDATLDREGRVFVFEADPAMVVHTGDAPELFPYKRRYVPRIFRAVEAMLDSRQRADN